MKKIKTKIRKINNPSKNTNEKLFEIEIDGIKYVMVILLCWKKGIENISLSKKEENSPAILIWIAPNLKTYDWFKSLKYDPNLILKKPVKKALDIKISDVTFMHLFTSREQICSYSVPTYKIYLKWADPDYYVMENSFKKLKKETGGDMDEFIETILLKIPKKFRYSLPAEL